MNASTNSPLQDGVAHLLAAALERDPAHREAFLAEACGEEHALLAEVQALLSAHEAMGQFLNEPAADDPELTSNLAEDDVPALESTEATAPMQPTERPVTSKPSASAYVTELPLPEDLQAWMPPGEYLIESFLGQGGMGAVYKGLQMPLRRPVAIKILAKRQSGAEDDFAFEERFKREAYAMATLTHPHIVQVYDCGDAGEHFLFISMELVEGGDLSDAIKEGRLTTEAALKFIPQICEGMQAAHERGVVHRDIKPANIFLTKDGRAKVADFGLAKNFHAKSTFVTKVGMGMGTPDYAAPEQYDGVPDLDHRADLYALGVMMYQMLTGRLPRGANYKTPSQMVGVDARIDDVVAKAMANEREERYQSAAEIAADLAIIATPAPRTVVTQTRPKPTKTGPAPRKTAPVSRPPTPTPGVRTGATPVPRRVAAPPMQKKSGAAGGIIAILIMLAVLAGGAWLMQRQKPKPTAPSAPTLSVWRPLFTDAEWKQTEPGLREVVDGRLHIQSAPSTTPPSATKPPSALSKPQPSADGAIRARIGWREGSGNVGVSARMAPDGGRYKLNLTSLSVKLLYITAGGGSNVLAGQELSKPRRPGDTLLIELRTQGERLTALVDGAVVADIRDLHLPGPGEWGINATDGWFESVEVQTLPPATAPQAAPVVSGFGPWRPLLTEAEWNQTSTNREVVGGRLHLQTRNELKRQPAADGAIRARIQLGEASRDASLVARQMPDGSKYKLQRGVKGVDLIYFSPADRGGNPELLRTYALPAGAGIDHALLLEFRLQGDRLTALVDGAIAFEVRDSRDAGPGLWGINSTDGWFESVEVQTPPAVAATTTTTASTLPASAADGGWQDLLALLTPELVEQTGHGWSLKDDALQSPGNERHATLPLPGSFAGSSYRARVKIRQLTVKDSFSVILPVADRMVQFVLDGRYEEHLSGLQTVDGKGIKDVPGTLPGKQVKDSAPHDLEVTVRLDGANAKITVTLDSRPFYEWAGPTASLDLYGYWATTPPGSLALGTNADDWAVSAVKVKRLDAGKLSAGRDLSVDSYIGRR